MATSKVLYEKRGPVAYVTLNRPEVKNAIDVETSPLLPSTNVTLPPASGFYPDRIFGVGGFRHAYTIVTVFCFPVGPFDDVAVGIRTAAPYAACRMLEPVVKRRVLIASIQVARRRWPCHQSKKAYRLRPFLITQLGQQRWLVQHRRW